MIKKLISEFVGTMFLVFFGCGTAVALGMYASLPYNHVLIALAFGLILTLLIYIFGKISGAHLNPAVSLAMLIDGRMSIIEFIEYIVVQILGGIAGAEIIALIFGGYTSLGANGFDTASFLQTYNANVNITAVVALIVEAILTFVFVLTVLSITKKENNYSGIVAGLALTLVHIFGLPITGTSVNPARSIGPAILTSGDSSLALSQLWVFIVGPLVGAALAGLFYRFVLSDSKKETENGEKKVVKKIVIKKSKAA